MISQYVKLIDETVAFIKAKDESISSFDHSVLHKFEFKLFLSLDIFRFELQTTNEISDLTADAITTLFVFGCFEFYYRDYPEIYKQCSSLFTSINSYNEKAHANTLRGKMNQADNDKWIDFFKKVVPSLLVKTPEEK